MTIKDAPTTVREGAYYWIEQVGYAIIPLHDVHSGKCSCGDECGNRAGKHPRIKDYRTNASRDPQIVDAWLERWPNMNIGVVTGDVNNVFVVDIDDSDLVQQFMSKYKVETFTTLSGSGNPHFWYEMPKEDITNSRGLLKTEGKIDVRGNGGYVVVAPSRTHKGDYHVVGGEITKAPDALIKALLETRTDFKYVTDESLPKYKDLSENDKVRMDAWLQSAAKAEVEKLMGLKHKGSTHWNDTLFAVACNLYEMVKAPWTQNNDPDRVAIYILQDGVLPPFDNEGWTEAAVKRTIESAKRTVFKDERCRAMPEDRHKMDAIFETEGLTHEQLVLREMERIRARREAQRRINEEEAALAWAPPEDEDDSLDVLLRQPRVEQKYTIDRVLPKDANASLIASNKVGKTTLVGNLIKSLADGIPYLNQYEVKFEGNIALWNYELVDWQMIDWLRKHEIQNTKAVKLKNLRGESVPLQTDQGRQWAIEWLKKREIKMWIVDPVGRAYMGWGDEIDNTRMREFLQCIEEIKLAAGVEHVVLVTHTGHVTKDSPEIKPRGASVQGDWPDVKWFMRRNKDTNTREIRFDGRDVWEDWQELAYETKTGALAIDIFETEFDQDDLNAGMSTNHKTLLKIIREANHGSMKLTQTKLGAQAGLNQSTVNRALKQNDTLKAAWETNQCFKAIADLM